MPQPLINKQNQESTPVKKTEIEDIFEHEDDSKEKTIEEQPAVEKVEKKPVPIEIKQQVPETSKDIAPDKKFEAEQKKEGELDQMKPAPPSDPDPPIEDEGTVSSGQKSVELIKIENILSEHLDELFLTMTPQEQMAFKKKGEETAQKVNELMQETKIKVKEILVLIREWLKIIPGVNKFFIEQEAKIKTDRLLNLREKK